MIRAAAMKKTTQATVSALVEVALSFVLRNDDDGPVRGSLWICFSWLLLALSDLHYDESRVSRLNHVESG